MFSESQLAILKKIVLEEMEGDASDKELFDEMVEKTKTPAFSEAVNLIVDSLNRPHLQVFPPEWGGPLKQDFYEASARICEELEIPTELLVFFKDKIANESPTLSLEENIRNGIRYGKEFVRIEQKKN